MPISLGDKPGRLRLPALIPAAIFIVVIAPWREAAAQSAPGILPTPGFHHLHLNSVDPDAAIAFYTRQFPSTVKTSFAGFPALKAGNVYVLFTRVKTPPAIAPQTAIWHFGWHVVDVHKSYETYRQRSEVHLLPLYTTDEGGSVFVSSDTWPGVGGSLGLTKAQIADAKARGVQPTHGAGFAYLEGPDGAIIEYQGNMPAERFNHVHLFERNPYCAELWYQEHLNAPRAAGLPRYTEANCKVPRPERSWPALQREGMFRMPAGVTFDDVALTWHVQQDDTPLAGSRGHLADHIALSVSDLDAWIAKLRREHVKFLTKPYKLGNLRAVMIEGPSREALELVEIK
jgi:catechol 2,3-dioxygenase-like lactoylglutathione lyase family enzyme